MKKWILTLALLLALGGCGAPTAELPAQGDGLTVWYLDVGQADAAVLQCDGQVLMIDGGERNDSDFIYAWLEDQGIDRIDHMVCTHAHEDHVGGLPGALNYASVGAAYAPVTEADTKVFQNYCYYVEQQGLELTVPQPGDTFSLGSARVEVLGPVTDYSDANNTSIVLRVTYGQTSFLFTGDMEIRAEQDLLETGRDLSATVLKVGHHGSDTSTGEDFLQAVDPEYAVISVGQDNDYGHPSPSVLDRLGEQSIPIYRTDELGSICCVSDGRELTFSYEKNTLVVTPQPEPGPALIGNRNTKKFHDPACS